MKEILSTICLTIISTSFSTAFAQWKPVEERLMTEWGANLDTKNVLPEYPRPIMERADWQNLNGQWQYAIVPKDSPKPVAFEGDITVPFAVESTLSGVGRMVGDANELWYERNFTIPSNWKGKRIMLNFDAVDWKADVWINDIKIGCHTGGYAPFSFDITPALKKGDNTLTVKVWDPTDKGEQPRGKQVSDPKEIWYTPVTGIWQTVWLEPVNPVHIKEFKVVPNIDNNTLTVNTELSDSKDAVIAVSVLDNGSEIAGGLSVGGEPIVITMPKDIKLWTPDSPALYDLKISVSKNGKTTDLVKSYTAMRKFSTAKDSKGVTRLHLNNKPLFMFGPLDQGYWPDGLYTAPSDEALKYDLERIKDFGFNMVRKHIKVEPARWYTYCDRLGIIVWQDMPSGGNGPVWQMKQYFDGEEAVRSEESEAQYRKEWKEIMDTHYSYPCIGVWIPFNEAWGQFKTQEIADWTKKYDSSRLVNPASGGNHYLCGDILDLHHYHEPNLYLYDGSRATVLGEYGGMCVKVDGNMWDDDKICGYLAHHSEKSITDHYVQLAEMLRDMSKNGFSAAVYTQLTDVEYEANGLMTYDRKKDKLTTPRVRAINKALTYIFNKQ